MSRYGGLILLCFFLSITKYWHEVHILLTAFAQNTSYNGAHRCTTPPTFSRRNLALQLHEPARDSRMGYCRPFHYLDSIRIPGRLTSNMGACAHIEESRNRRCLDRLQYGSSFFIFRLDARLVLIWTDPIDRTHRRPLSRLRKIRI